MPKIQDAFKSIEISLPSYPDSKIKLNTKIQIKHLLEAEKMEQAELAIYLASKMILEWNFDDEKGQPLPINEQNLSLFPAEDLQYILDKITPFIEKKTLSDKTK